MHELVYVLTVEAFCFGLLAVILIAQRCFVPPQATPSSMHLSSRRIGANSKFNPRTTKEDTR